MPDKNRRGAAFTKVIAGKGEEGLRLPLPFLVIAALAGSRPLLVEPSLALLRHARHRGAALTLGVSLAAMAADGGSANRHDQAIGARAGMPLKTMAPAAIDVPPAFVSAMRMYRLLPI